MEKCTLDTDILPEYLKGYDSVVIGHAAQYAHERRAFSFTSVTVYEIVYDLQVKARPLNFKRSLRGFDRMTRSRR
jgi:hypothetical protein